MNPGLAPEIAELLEEDAELGAQLAGLSYAEQRPVIREAVARRFADVEPLVAQTHVDEHVIPVDGGLIRLHVYRPPAPRTRGVFFHIHGGGFTLGSVDDLFTVAKCAHISAQVGCIVTTVDYRLAPEFPYPTPPEDCYAALSWVVDNAASLGVDGTRVVIGGESAGGNLAAAVALMARDRGGPDLALQLLEVPVTDMSAESKTYSSLHEFGHGYGLDATVIDAFEAAYLPVESDRGSGYASPLRAADVTELPPVHLVTAELDPLRDSGEAYARRLYEAGVPTTIHRFLGHTHGSAALWRSWPPAADWMHEIVTVLSAATSGAPRIPARPNAAF
jgi:acetyl esterase